MVGAVTVTQGEQLYTPKLTSDWDYHHEFSTPSWLISSPDSKSINYKSKGCQCSVALLETVAFLHGVSEKFSYTFTLEQMSVSPAEVHHC